MGSKRFPGKVTADLDGLPILVHCIRRLRKINTAVPVIVATSDLDQDDAIASMSCNESARVFRGSEPDVLDRFYKTAREYEADYIVRATADNPFVDPDEGMRVVEAIRSGSYDYVSGFESAESRKLPVGVGLEAFTFRTLRRSWLDGHLPHHREHVNEYILEHPRKFSIHHLPCRPQNNGPDLHLTVDTHKDLEDIKIMVTKCGKPALELQTQDLIRWHQLQTVTL